MGVPLATTMMTMAAITMMVGALPRCPMGSGTSSRPPSKGTKQNLASRGSWRPPHWDRDWLGVGGFGMPTTGPDNHRNLNGGKIEEGIEGGEDRRRDFERVFYVVQIAPPMPPRGRWRKGMD